MFVPTDVCTYVPRRRCAVVALPDFAATQMNQSPCAMDFFAGTCSELYSPLSVLHRHPRRSWATAVAALDIHCLSMSNLVEMSGNSERRARFLIQFLSNRFLSCLGLPPKRHHLPISFGTPLAPYSLATTCSKYGMYSHVEMT